MRNLLTLQRVPRCDKPHQHERTIRVVYVYDRQPCKVTGSEYNSVITTCAKADWEYGVGGVDAA